MDPSALPPTLRVVRNGAIQDLTNGRMISGPPHPVAGAGLARKRWDKHRRVRQKAVIDAVAEALELPQDGAAMISFGRAVAQADGETFKVLWRDIVMGSRSRLRDRVMAYAKLGQIAGLPGMEREREEEGVSVTVRVSGDALSALAGVLGRLPGLSGPGALSDEDPLLLDQVRDDNAPGEA